MVSKRFLTVLLVIGTALKLCNGSSCHDTSRDANTEWRAADVLEELGHDFYQSFALGPFDAKDPEKRFVAVYGQALFYYITSKAPCEEERVQEAVERASKQLQESSEMLSGQMRGAVSLMYNFVELPLTDVQQACPYYVCEASCHKALAELQAEKIKCCPGYKHNLELYNISTEFVTSCGLQSHLREMVDAVAKPSDEAALKFFSDATLIRYPEAMQLLRKIFTVLQSIPPSEVCTMFSFL